MTCSPRPSYPQGHLSSSRTTSPPGAPQLKGLQSLSLRLPGEEDGASRAAPLFCSSSSFLVPNARSARFRGHLGKQHEVLYPGHCSLNTLARSSVLLSPVPPVWKWKLHHKGSTGPHSRLSLLSSLTGCACCSLWPPTQSESGQRPGMWAQRPPRLQGSPRPVPAHARAKPALPARQKVALCGRRSGPREGTAGTCQIKGEPSLLRGTE